MKDNSNKARISILIASGLLLIIVGVLALVTTSNKAEFAGFPLVGLGNLLVGLSYKHPPRSYKQKVFAYSAAAASLVGIILFGIYWFRLLT